MINYSKWHNIKVKCIYIISPSYQCKVKKIGISRNIWDDISQSLTWEWPESAITNLLPQHRYVTIGKKQSHWNIERVCNARRPQYYRFFSSFRQTTFILVTMVNTVDTTAINTIRTLAADVVRGANSGHPGKFNLLVFRPLFPKAIAHARILTILGPFYKVLPWAVLQWPIPCSPSSSRLTPRTLTGLTVTDLSFPTVTLVLFNTSCFTFLVLMFLWMISRSSVPLTASK